MNLIKRIPGIVAMSLLAVFEAAAQFSGGSGTLADPYKISTLNDLVTLSTSNTYIGNHFIQTADINASSTSTLNSGQGFRGIGSPSNRFTGTYNGNNKTITGLFINRPATSSMGLFRSTSGATIKDLNLVNVNITANDNTAAVVGWALGSTVIQNVKVTGTSTITANATDCGGIAGEAENSTLTGCYVSATIAGVNNTGGLIGFCCISGTSTTISRCYTNGSISSSGSNVGGLIGTNEQTVVNCYSTASVTSGTNIGGLAGSNTGTITNCYSRGALTGSAPVGGFVGTNTGSVTNCFWDTQTSGAPSSAAGEGKTTAFMQSPCTYEETGWDFAGETDNGTDNIWTINTTDNGGYPALSSQGYSNAFNCAAPFITTWSFSANTTSLQFKTLTATAPVLYTWTASPSGNSGSGSFSNTTGGTVTLSSLNFVAGDEVTITMEAHNLRRFYMDGGTDKNKLKGVSQWGGVKWSSLNSVFMGCRNLSVYAMDAPDMSNVTDMTEMFNNSNFDYPIGNWNVSNIASMARTFTNSSFNQSLGDWTFKAGVDLTAFLDNGDMDCVNYSQSLIGWAANASTPSGLNLSASGLTYGTSATSAHATLAGSKGWTITGDNAGTAHCLPCPNLTTAPSDVIITNSVCSPGCIPAGGSIAPPAGMPCPLGSTIQYKLNNGVWSYTIPTYDQDGPPQSIKTRCKCDSYPQIESPQSGGENTVPGTCTPPVPVLFTTETSGVSPNDGIICAGSAVNVSASGGVSYEWSNGHKTSAFDISPFCSGSYEVTVSDINDCTQTAVATIDVNQAPSVQSVSPGSGSAGTIITISGSYLSNVTDVKFNGVSSTGVNVISSTQVQASLPASGAFSEVKVVTLCGEVIVKSSAPTVSSISPLSGPVGTVITISGSNLGQIHSASVGGTGAVILSKSDNSAVIAVMPGSTSNSVSVVSLAGTGTSSGNFTVQGTPYPYFQQGTKKTNSVFASQQGASVAVSSDGNTAVIGAPGDNSGKGAAYIYVRSGNTWSQQGAKLVGTGAVGNARQGTSVAISDDGNTIAIGGNYDNSNIGAVWMFVRNGTVWSQQGSKLVGIGSSGTSLQGTSVSLSGDGNRLAVGAAGDNAYKGAVWLFARQGSGWYQRGDKLSLPMDGIGVSRFGTAVACSGDGGTLLVGGPYDDNRKGATWIYSVSDCQWSLQGKVIGSGTSSQMLQGCAVSVSDEGGTAIIGGSADNNLQGAAWVFKRVSNVWSEQAKLNGNWLDGASRQGSSVSLSADGNTAIVGGFGDNTSKGAMWVYKRTGSSWAQMGGKLSGTGAVGAAFQGASVSVSADGKTALIGGAADASGKGAFWVFSNTQSLLRETVSDREDSSVLGSEFTLQQNVPNPLSDRTSVVFTLPEPCTAEWQISDMSGRVVLVLKRDYPAGQNTEIFELKGYNGVYWYTLKTPFGVRTRKMIITGW